jgi:hypothetical protein
MDPDCIINVMGEYSGHGMIDANKKGKGKGMSECVMNNGERWPFEWKFRRLAA